MGDTTTPPAAGSCDAVNVCHSSGSDTEGDGEHDLTDPEMEQHLHHNTAAASKEGFGAVKLVDEELAELEQLIELQQRKIDALGRLRKQWLSGEREISARVELPRELLADGSGSETIAPAGGAYQEIPGRAYQWGASQTLPQIPTGMPEKYMTPHARFPLASPVVATELLSFRLKGGKTRPSPGGSGGGGSSNSASSRQYATGGARFGYLNVFVFLHADGTVRLLDMNGEEILAFDAGHRRSDRGAVTSPAAILSSSAGVGRGYDETVEESATAAAAAAEVARPAPVTGLAADTSEASPVLVTAGADGTARVHALSVYYRGRRVAGAGSRGGRGRRDGANKPEEGPPGGGGAGSSGHGSGPREQQDKVPQTTAANSGEDIVGEYGGGISGSSSSKESRRCRDEDARGGGTDEGDSTRGSGLPRHPATGMGVGITVESKTCLGTACGDSGSGSRPDSAETAYVGVDAGAEAAASAGATVGVGSLPMHGEAAAVTSIDAYFHRSLGATVVIAGYSSGGVRFFHAGNGTELSSVDAGSAVLAVKRSGQSIAFSDGEDVHFVNAAKFTRAMGRVCRGGRRDRSLSSSSDGDGGRNVTALAFDAISTGVLYVGFGTGEVMAYDSRLQEADGSYACLPSHRLPPPAQQSPPASHVAGAAGLENTEGGRAGGGGGGPDAGCESISTVRGYAIVSLGPLLSVYNTTDGDSRLLFTRYTHAAAGGAAEAIAAGRGDPGPCSEGVLAGFGGGGGPAAFAGSSKWSVMSSNSGELLMAEVPRCSAEMIVHRAVLPYDRSVPDISWMRVPVLLLGLLVVAVTQVYSRRAAKTAVGRTSRRRAGRGWVPDDGDAGGGFSVDGQADLHSRGDLGSRGRLSGRDWKEVTERRSFRGDGGTRESFSRLPPARQGYGKAWEPGDYSD